MKDKIKRWLADEGNRVAISFAIIGAILCAVFFLTSCKQIQVVTQTKTEYVHDTTQVHDSIFRDRIVEKYHKGDTIYLKDSVFVYKYKYLDKVKEVIIRDSIPYPVEVEKIVKKRSSYDKFCSRFFWISAVALLLIIAGWVLDKIYGWTNWVKMFFRK